MVVEDGWQIGMLWPRTCGLDGVQSCASGNWRAVKIAKATSSSPTVSHKWTRGAEASCHDPMADNQLLFWKKGMVTDEFGVIVHAGEARQTPKKAQRQLTWPVAGNKNNLQ